MKKNPKWISLSGLNVFNRVSKILVGVDENCVQRKKKTEAKTGNIVVFVVLCNKSA